MVVLHKISFKYSISTQFQTISMIYNKMFFEFSLFCFTKISLKKDKLNEKWKIFVHFSYETPVPLCVPL